MLNKEVLQLIPFASGIDYTNKVQGSITANLYEYIGTYIGYSKLSGLGFGSCTNSQLLCLYSYTSKYGEKSAVFSPDDERFTINRVCCGSMSISVASIYKATAFFIQIPTGNVIGVRIFAKQPKYIVRHTNDLDGTHINYCREIHWPQVANADDIYWSKDVGEDGHNISYSDTYVEPGTDSPVFGSVGTLEERVPNIDLEDGKTYDFTLEYKIDAIITEDGVQTF